MGCGWQASLKQLLDAVRVVEQRPAVAGDDTEVRHRSQVQFRPGLEPRRRCRPRSQRVRHPATTCSPAT